jgi:hypothetical protein
VTSSGSSTGKAPGAERLLRPSEEHGFSELRLGGGIVSLNVKTVILGENDDKWEKTTLEMEG